MMRDSRGSGPRGCPTGWTLTAREHALVFAAAHTQICPGRARLVSQLMSNSQLISCS